MSTQSSPAIAEMGASLSRALPVPVPDLDFLQLTAEELVQSVNDNPEAWLTTLRTWGAYYAENSKIGIQGLTEVTALQAALAQEKDRSGTLVDAIAKLSITPSPALTIPEDKNSSRYKPPAPTKFDGSREELKNFLTQMDVLFQGNPDMFRSETTKVSCVAGSLKGRALTQTRPYMIKLMDNFPTYDLMRKFLNDTFGDPDPVTTARNALHNLSQKTKDIPTYLAEFNTHAPESEYDDKAKMDFLKRGLNNDMRGLLVHEPDYEDMKLFQASLLKLEQKHNQLVHHGKPISRSNATPYTRTTTTISAPRPAVAPIPASTVPMDLSGTRRPPLTPEEKERRKIQGLCNYCGDSDHAIVACPKIRCYNCGDFGHSTRSCTKPGRITAAAATVASAVTPAVEEEPKN